MKHGTISALGRFLGCGMEARTSRLRATISVVCRQVSLLGGCEFAVAQQTKDLVERATSPSMPAMLSSAIMRPQISRIPAMAARIEWFAQITVEMPASRYAATGVR